MWFDDNNNSKINEYTATTNNNTNDMKWNSLMFLWNVSSSTKLTTIKRKNSTVTITKTTTITPRSTNMSIKHCKHNYYTPIDYGVGNVR